MSMESKHHLQPRQSANGGTPSITSLVLGLLSLFGACLTGIPGLIFGILGLGEINRSRGRVSGRGLWNRVQQPWNRLERNAFVAFASLASTRNSSGQGRGETTAQSSD